MYDGTLGTKGPWQALVTFQQLIILADQVGIVDMTPEAISRRSTIPLEIITIGLKALETPDPDSRSPEEQGRRIVRLSDGRAWGWHIVNYEHYRTMRSTEERREYMKQYQRKRRASLSTKSTPRKQRSTSVSNVTQAVSSKQEAEGDVTKAFREAALNGKTPGQILAHIKSLAQERQVPGQGSTLYIPHAQVELLGPKYVAAYDAIGGADRVLTTLGKDWGFVVRDFTRELGYT